MFSIKRISIQNIVVVGNNYAMMINSSKVKGEIDVIRWCIPLYIIYYNIIIYIIIYMNIYMIIYMIIYFIIYINKSSDWCNASIGYNYIRFDYNQISRISGCNILSILYFILNYSSQGFDASMYVKSI